MRWFVPLTLALMLPIAGAYAAPPFAPPASSATTVYRHARLIDGTGTPAQVAMTIVVTGETISAVVSDADYVPAPGAKLVDLTGKTVIPGLIDSHVHLATPPNRIQAEAVLRRDVYGGVTAVRDMADDLRAVAELAREGQQGEIAAPDIAFAALMAGPPFFADPRVSAASTGWTAGTAPWMQMIDTQTDLPLAVAQAKGTGAAAIKIYADLPAGLIAAITAEAHRQHMLVWAHSAVFPSRPADVIGAGPDAISHVCYLAYQREPVMLTSYEDHTPVHEALITSPEDPVMAGLFQTMLNKGMILDATGSLFVHGDAELLAHPERSPKRCGGALTTRLTRQAWRAGVPISTGTDSIGPSVALWPEMYEELFFLVRDVGMPPLEAIRSATLIGAKAMGQAAKRGSVTVGKLADFVVLAADPLADIANVRSIVMTVKHGRAFARGDFVPLTADEISDR